MKPLGSAFRDSTLGQRIYYGILTCFALICIACSSAPTTYLDAEGKPLPEEQQEEKRAEEEAKRAERSLAFDREVDAQTFAVDYVKQYLKYPLDAEFGWGQQVRTDGNGIYFVTGTVKAANALGAKLTHEYIVKMELDDRGGTDTWSLLACQVGDELLFQAAEPGSGTEAVAPTEPTEPTAQEVKQQEVEERRQAALAKVAAAKSEAVEAAKTRTWHTSDGKFSVEAKFLTAIGGVAHLKRTDNGAEIKVPLEQLSTDDQDFITGRRWNEAGQ